MGKFGAPEGSETKFLNMRDDALEFGSEVPVEGKSNILHQLALALKKRDDREQERTAAAAAQRIERQREQDEQERKKYEMHQEEELRRTARTKKVFSSARPGEGPAVEQKQISTRSAEISPEIDI